MPWYVFNPIDPFPHNPCDPNNYVLIGSTPPSCPGANNYLCAIQAADNLGKPIITPALCNEIALALLNHIDTVNVLLRS